MIILGWIGFVLLFILFVTMIGKNSKDSFREAFVNCCIAFAWMVTIIGSCIGLMWLLLILLHSTFEKPSEPDMILKPTILSCNGVTVAESINGFAFNSKSGTYEDYRSSLTYTPRQGEACKQYLKENK